MTMYRKLILGSAASFLAMGGAQAADLPVKAKAVEYVRICSLYGAGFFYIPGTDTCIKLGGYLRADTTFNGGAHGAPAWSGDLGQQNRFRDNLLCPFAHGADGRYPHRHRIWRGPHLRPGRLPVPEFRQAPTPATLDRHCHDRRPQQRFAFQRGRRLCRGRVSFHPVRRLHLRQVGFGLRDAVEWLSRATSIRTCSAATIPIPASTTSSTRRSSATASPAASASMIRRCGIARPSIICGIPGAIGANGTGSSAYGGADAPDIVGRIRIDQAWGLFQLSAAAHEVNGFLQQRWRPAPCRTTFLKSAATPTASGAVR